MATAMLKRTAMVKSMMVKGLQETCRRRAFASIAEGTDLVAAAPNVSLQKARTWDEGVSSKFSTTPLKDIFKGKKVVIFGLPGAYTGVCSVQHVPSYKNNIDKFKAKGIDSVICVAVNDPYTMNGWAEKLNAKDANFMETLMEASTRAWTYLLISLLHCLDLALIGGQPMWLMDRSRFIIRNKLLLTSRFPVGMLYWDRSKFIMQITSWMCGCGDETYQHQSWFCS